jgi:hypothetical protein
VRNDQGTFPDRPEDPSPDRPATARSRAVGPSTVVLALLMAGTCWAVASWVSAWLVPPYLILMALLLFPSTGRPQGVPGEADRDASDPLRPAQPGEGLDDPDSPPDASAPEDGSEQATSSSPVKGRRGKGRAKKARPVPGPTEATWVQVAPGKFVRVEAPQGQAEAGPHELVGVPVEVAATPQMPENDEGNALEEAEGRGPDEAPPGAELTPLSEASREEPDHLEETAEDAEPASEFVGGPEGEPIGGVESESSTAFEGDERAGSPGFNGGPSTADGNAPEAEGPYEDLEARWPAARLEAVDEWAEAGPVGEMSGVGGERSPSTEDLEPTGPPSLADVPPEEVDEWGETFHGPDPTETPVDETDLDDAGPFEDDPHHLDAPPTDADSPGTAVPPGTLPVPSWWPWRFVPRAGTRVGHPPREIDREATPRRPVRSTGSSRRPHDPRRLTRRGAGRPRQITRTFPPRSPPWRSYRPGRSRLTLESEILESTFWEAPWPHWWSRSRARAILSAPDFPCRNAGSPGRP